MPTQLNGATLLYPIIGDPVKYAESPDRLTREFGKRGHNGLCIPLEVREADLDAVMTGLTAPPNVAGLLVTMPHKATTFAYCSTSSKRAKLLGVVSVMRRNPDGTWHGDMLDGLAFVKAQTDHGAHVANARALLIGAGSAGSQIALALIEAGVRELRIHDTSSSRADHLKKLLTGIADARINVTGPDPIGCDLVFNATPMGMNDSDPLPIAPSQLTSSMFVGDVIAGHGVTAFIRASQEAGCAVATGIDMVKAEQNLMASFMLGE